MDIRDRRGPEDDPEGLRRLLRRYEVPGAPAALEDELRATFRRQVSQRERLSALAFAASVTVALGAALLTAAWLSLGPAGTATHTVDATPVASPGPTVAAAPTAPPAAVIEPAPPSAAAAPPRRAPAVRRVAAPSREPDVLIAPGQLEMLRSFARGLRAVPDAGGRVGEYRHVQFVETPEGIQIPISVADPGGEV